MQITRSSEIPDFILVAAIATSVVFTTPVFAQQNQNAYIVDLTSKQITKIDTLGGSFSRANDINDSGQVVGQSVTAADSLHAFITGPDGIGTRDLEVGGRFTTATGVNEAGQVVGRFYTDTGPARPPTEHAFITGPNGIGVTDLGTLDRYGYGYSINNHGQIAGNYEGDVFITGPNGVGFTRITEGRFADDVNDSGQVVGISDHLAFITGPNGVGFTDLGTLGGISSSAHGINNSGQVVGKSTTAEGVQHAFITGPNGLGMRDLGAPGGFGSVATDINEAGQVVGYFVAADGSIHAFFTGADGVGMTDLNSLVSLPGPLLSYAPIRINNHGQLLLSAVPEPQTYAMLFAGLCLLGFVSRRFKFA